MPLLRLHKAIDADPRWLYQYNVTREFLDSWASAFETHVAALLDGVSLAAFEEALSSGDLGALLQGIPWKSGDAQLIQGWRPLIEEVMARAGAAEITRLRLPIRFDLQNPFALRWIENHVAELVTQVTNETKLAIRSVVLQGFENGDPPRRMARRIREMVGLTQRDALAVERYWRTLAGDGTLNAKRVNELTDKYAAKLLRRRSENIARSETVAASNSGTMASWDQARSQGLIAPEAKRKWLAAMESGRTCDICLELGDAEPVGLDEPWYSSVLGQPVMQPPSHPSCRCSMGLLSAV